MLSLFLLGLGAGAALGVFAGRSILLPASGDALSEVSPDEAVVTYAGPAASGDASSDPLGSILQEQGTGMDRTRQVLTFVDGVKPGEFAAQIDTILSRRRGGQGADLISSLYEKWVGIDPAAALHHAEALEGKDRKSALTAVLSARAVKEPYEVIAWLEEKGDGEHQTPVYAALRAIAKDDPEEAIKLLEAKKSLRGGGRTVNADGRLVTMSAVGPGFLYGIWAARDPRAASASALTITNSEDRSSVLRGVAKEWSEKDPAAAWEWASQLESPRDQESVYDIMISAVMAKGETDRAIAFLDEMTPGKPRAAALSKIALYMAMTDPTGAVDFVRRQVRTSGDESAYAAVLSQWSQTEPGPALEAALALESGKARGAALRSIIGDAARRDPASALTMLGQIDTETMSDSIYSVAYTLAREDVHGALAWAEKLPEGDTRQNAFSNIFSEWSRQNPGKACDYAIKIKDEEIRRRGIQSTLSSWGYQDAVGAMTWAVENLNTKEQLNIIPGSLINTWADQDIDGATEWIEALSEGDLRQRTVESLIQNWANTDLVAPGNWLKKLSPGETRDRAVSSYVGYVFRSDPEAALIWANTITNPESRLNRVENFARRYLEDSPEKAKLWITSSTLPPEKKAELLNRSPQN